MNNRIPARVAVGLVATCAALLPACRGSSASPSEDTLSPEEYQARCSDLPVGELTRDADAQRGKLVRYSGEVVTFESKEGTTNLIVSVVDPSHTLPSGRLPVLLAYAGDTDAFIGDEVTAYGRVHGSVKYEMAGIEAKVLPRIDAKYLTKARR